ncbi:hypothetical protein Moror_7989 [Moniliophthora roreri MCA 2997]|uniref:Uncharacterized protein n=2 Tax=Moniliophthora roreri TaxID=221103 RepID=V2XLA2_MONRO|nr:hypothetical protein Moror_7989 [Moniliophthora roreri MCA 2997]KAI3610749.1 hypothetical protein WG66_006922 [Moniliophthora roreri]
MSESSSEGLPTELPTSIPTEISPTSAPPTTQSQDEQQSAQESTQVPTQDPSSQQPPPSSDSSQPPPPSSSSNPPPPSSSNPPSSSPPPSSSNPPPSSSNPPSSSTASSTRPSSTTEPPSSTSSSTTTTSESHGPTSFTTFVTTSNGQVTTVTSALPSLYNPTASNNDGINRTAVIAGSTVAGLVLLFLLLAGVFIWRRHKNRETTFIENLIKRGREGKGAGSVGLLDDEFDDDDNVPMQRYRDAPRGAHTPSGSLSNPPSVNYAVPMSVAPMSNANVNASVSSVNTISRQVPASPAPSLFRTRASDSGSIFHEHIPGAESIRFVDPLTRGNGSEIDLSRIVDDIMGPMQGGVVASRSTTTATSSSSAPTSVLPPGAAAPVMYVDPFAAGSRTSFYSPGHTKDLSASSVSTVSSETGPKSLLGLPAGTATVSTKKPSPLAHTLTPPSSGLTVVTSPPPPSPSKSSLARPSTPTQNKTDLGVAVPTTPKSSRPTTPTTPSKTTNWLNRSPKPEALKNLNAKRDSRDVEYEYIFKG